MGNHGIRALSRPAAHRGRAGLSSLNVRLVGGYDKKGEALDVALTDSYAYVADCGRAPYHCCSDPAASAELGHCDSTTYSEGSQ